MAYKVGIGITSYADLTSKAVAEEVFESFAQTSSKLIPQSIKVRTKKVPITAKSDFVLNWLSEIPFEVREGRKVTGPLIDKGHYRIGAAWSREHALRGDGFLNARPETDFQRDDNMQIEYVFSPNIDWVALFEKLVAATNPSYAMLHLFEKHTGETFRFGMDQLEYLEGPIAGEQWFTAWKSSLNEWRRPDRFNVRERRRYRFLPDLSWLNYFGNEFEDQLNVAALSEKAAAVHHRNGGLTVQLTENLSDIIKQRAHLQEARMRVKECFERGFFRS